MFEVTPEPHDLARVRFIASDMDNTLLDGEGQLPDGVFERVVALSELGVTFAIASGRPLVTLRALFPRLRSQIVLIGDNGGVISNRDEVIYQAELPVADYQRMVRFANGFGDIPTIISPDTAYLAERDRGYDDVFATFYYDRAYVEDLATVSAVADKFTIYLPGEDSIPRAEADYEPAFGKDFSVVTSGSVWIDITPKGMDKGGAMRHVSELLGIDIADMMAFGDTFNDAAMLETVGFGYIVANATPGMERYARLVAPSNVDHGVLTVMDQVIAAKRAALGVSES